MNVFDAFKTLNKRQREFILGNMPRWRSGRRRLSYHDSPSEHGLSEDDVQALNDSGFITVERGFTGGMTLVLTPAIKQVVNIDGVRQRLHAMHKQMSFGKLVDETKKREVTMQHDLTSVV